MTQGDTREVGLDQVIANGASIRAAVKSAKWPTRAVNLEYSIVWSTPMKLGEEVSRYLAGEPVPLITSSLDAAETDAGKPETLLANQRISFIGTYVLGMGFIMSPEEAHRLIEHDSRNSDVLSPYINGEDLNSRPDSSASRWVINFFDWPLERAEEYPECLDIVRRLVKPERERNNRANYRDRWWRHAEHRPGLYDAIKGMGRVLAIAQTSRTMMPAWILMPSIPSHTVVVFAYEESARLALLSSTFHQTWAFEYGPTMRTDPRYAPSDIFVKFPQPGVTSAMELAGETLDQVRRPLMLERNVGLTALYNLLHGSGTDDAAIERLRKVHVDIDEAVAAAYGWDDLTLDHGVRQTAQGQRFAVSNAVRGEILHRLLDLNHRIHNDEKASGLAASGRGPAGRPDVNQMTLIDS
jgi:hypothetical protein